jgi:hypothetical protein
MSGRRDLELSIYADNTVIFLKATVPNASNLKSILLNFGMTTSL